MKGLINSYVLLMKLRVKWYYIYTLQHFQTSIIILRVHTPANAIAIIILFIYYYYKKDSRLIQSNWNLKFAPVSSKEYLEGQCVQGIKYMCGGRKFQLFRMILGCCHNWSWVIIIIRYLADSMHWWAQRVINTPKKLHALTYRQ